MKRVCLEAQKVKVMEKGKRIKKKKKRNTKISKRGKCECIIEKKKNV